MVEQGPPDQADRDRIAKDLDSTILVEAAAGTGKTTCLIGRMVALLREGKCSISTLAAVTFTRKAAAELRSRFQLALEQEVEHAPEEQRDALVAALGKIEQSCIGTIHSFCARLLRERPIEANVDPHFVELDERVDGQLREQAWRDHVAAMAATDDPVLPELERLGLQVLPSTKRTIEIANELDALGLEPARLGPAFLDLAEYPDVTDWPADPVSLPDLPPCREALLDYVSHIESLDLPDDYGNDRLIPKYGLIGRMSRQLDLEQPAQLMEVIEQFESSADIVQKAWPGKKKQAEAELAKWRRFGEQWAAPSLTAWRAHRYETVLRALRPAQAVYDQLRRERNGLNFQDLLLRAAALLRNHPEVRRYFRRRFTHLLVDEFQDTDPIQAEIMLLLTADDPHETDWSECRPAPGSLFVVGDPKQSIYRFRRADIVTYNRVRSIIESVGGRLVPLTANFRSSEPVVSWINNCFDQIFPPQSDEQNPANRPLEVGRARAATGENPPEDAIRRLLIPASVYDRPNRVAEYEAELIARSIRQAIDERWPLMRTERERELGWPDHATAGDFLIITRTTFRLTHYARQLQKYGIPHAVTGGKSLNEVPELELLYVCVRAVARNHDPIALVAALRSELFGVTDTTLYAFRRLGGQWNYRIPIPDGFLEDDPDGDAAALASAFERFKAYSDWLQRLPTAVAIERIAADMGLIARACAATDGDARAGGLLKAMDLIRSAPSLGVVADYVEFLAQLVDGDQPHDGAHVQPPAEAPVRVMNLHQCKGLEAPFVFLADPCGARTHNVEVHIDRSGDAPKGYLAVYGKKRHKYAPPSLLAHPLGWDDLANDELKFLNAEENRLLYVAATRAGARLVISQRDNEKKNEENPWRRFDAFLGDAAPLAAPGELNPTQPTPANEAAYSRDAVADVQSRWTAISKPSYAIEAIKQAAVGSQPAGKPRGFDADGAAWGNVIHTLLEAAMKKPGLELQRLAIAALENEQLALSLVDDAVATAQRVVQSPLWRRARQAKQCLVEAPLALLSNANDIPTVQRGVIDLVFQEDDDSWVIVDYKSERVDESQLDALVSYYRPQLAAYAKSFESIVGESVVEQGLFFTHSGSYLQT